MFVLGAIGGRARVGVDGVLLRVSNSVGGSRCRSFLSLFELERLLLNHRFICGEAGPIDA